MTRTTYVVGHTISWAAQQLVDQHGADAGRMAMANARRMAEEGRVELTTMWELVQGVVGDILDTEIEPKPIYH